MKRITTVVLLCMAVFAATAQDKTISNWPLTVTLFSESVGLPNFRSMRRNLNLGIRVGTEFYHKQLEGGQVLQTIQIGYYSHKDFQNGLFISSQVGYRKFFHQAFADATIGAGYMLVDSKLPRYAWDGSEYARQRSTFGRIMPTLGLGAGYQFKSFSLFSRYELFGEVPFGLRGIPALPHQAIHVGTRFNFKPY